MHEPRFLHRSDEFPLIIDHRVSFHNIQRSPIKSTHCINVLVIRCTRNSCQSTSGIVHWSHLSPSISALIIPFNWWEIVFAIISSNSINSVWHCNQWQSSPMFFQRRQHFPLACHRIKSLSWTQTWVIWSSISSHCIYFIIRSNSNS